jgi:DNA-binding NarL/FixJ family response regulator
LIIFPPGDLQISLQVLLATRLEVDVLVTGEESSAMKVVERYCPTMVILDHDLPFNIAPTIIQWIKSSWPDIHCVDFVKDEEERQKVMDSEVDLIMIKGIPGRKVVAEIEKLLRPEGLDPSISERSEEDIQNQEQA